MDIESYIRKNYRHRSDRAMAMTLCTTPGKIALIRQHLGLKRDVQTKHSLKFLTPHEREAWHRGTFDPHETDWFLSGLTR